MKKVKVYIAGPYSSNPIENTNRAIEVWETLHKKGFIPFCPHLTHFLHERYPHEYKEWLEYDMIWLELCDCVFRFEGESSGADAEVKRAKELGINVFTSLYEIETSYEDKNH